MPDPIILASRGLLRDYESSDAIRMQLFEALQCTMYVLAGGGGPAAGRHPARHQQRLLLLPDEAHGEPRPEPGGYPGLLRAQLRRLLDDHSHGNTRLLSMF